MTSQCLAGDDFGDGAMITGDDLAEILGIKTLRPDSRDGEAVS
jgi:hypothetical protein